MTPKGVVSTPQRETWHDEVRKHLMASAVTSANLRAALQQQRKAGSPRGTIRYLETNSRILLETREQFLTVIAEHRGSISGYLEHIGVNET